ncbi:hypothetical protein BpHYR1_038050 [Brachionus plicatilis]|uniref:Uncharacterized protein n=1 Tax=Brachionus plicatilis TaxID=10195 RepID=A0A3M7P322_BRAPC|nr:hypothetical protein BpHYR1_038050 [Brachionus plicatilis]
MLKKKFRPCIARLTIDFANDLELPGLPTMNNGIRSSMQTIIMNTFSNRAEFRAIKCSGIGTFHCRASRVRPAGDTFALSWRGICAWSRCCTMLNGSRPLNSK